MATAVRDLRPTATATTAPVPPAPIPTAPSRAPAPDRPSERMTTGLQPRQTTEVQPQDPYDQPVSPWILILYLALVFLVLDVGMVWAGARLVAGTGG